MHGTVDVSLNPQPRDGGMIALDGEENEELKCWEAGRIVGRIDMDSIDN